MYGLLGAMHIMLFPPLADQYGLKSPSENIFQSRLKPSQPTAENFVRFKPTLWSVLVQQYPCCGFHRYFESAVLRFTHSG